MLYSVELWSLVVTQKKKSQAKVPTTITGYYTDGKTMQLSAHLHTKATGY